jgi:hypothetical protein
MRRIRSCTKSKKIRQIAPPKLSPLSLSLSLFSRLQLDDIHLEGYYYNVEENLKPYNCSTCRDMTPGAEGGLLIQPWVE